MKTKQSQMQKAEGNPWLASFFLWHGERMLRRFIHFYQRLHALPCSTRQLLQKRLATTLAGTALLLALSGAPSVQAAGITVTPGAAGINGGDGCSLVEAITNANNDAGTHAECPAGSGPDIITLAGNTYSYTSAYGTNTALPDITSNITIDGNGAAIQRLTGDMRLLKVNTGGNLILNNATITGGAGINDGGGIYNSGTLTVNDSVITGNTVYYGGGGIQNYGGAVTVNNSTISNNSAEDGSGIMNHAYYSAASAIINNSVISGNSGVWGGGIVSYGSNHQTATLTINSSTISGNTNSGGGGGVVNYGYSYGAANAVINNTTVDNNSTGGSGGGIANWGGYSGTANMIINNSTISGNTAVFNGGGIYNYTDSGPADLTINNSTISGNTAVNGGGIYNYNYNAPATITLNRSLISGNSATNGQEVNQPNGVIIANNRNLFGNSSQTNNDAFDGLFAPGGNDINATSDGSNVALNSILDTTLANNSPNGDPNTPDYPDTHALVSGSPAIDQIPASAADTNCHDSGSSTDQRGGARANPAFGSGIACDIGAFEYGALFKPTAINIQGLSARSSEDADSSAMLGATGLLAMLTGGFLARFWRRET